MQEGVQSISARDRILREICSNSLAHRDYSSGYVAKFVIERNRLYTENANRSHGHGALHLSSFEPYAKNPPISKVFREIGLADELGSGMRNTYKYTKLYSGGTPEFIEGDVFRTVIPLTSIRYLRPLLDKGQLRMTIPDKPRSQHQKYVATQKSTSEN